MVIFDGYVVAEAAAGQTADADHGDAAAGGFGLLGGNAPEGCGGVPVVIEIVGGDHHLQPFPGVKEVAADDGASVDREAVVVDAFRAYPKGGGGRDDGFRQRHVHRHIELKSAELVPVFVDVHAAGPRSGLPQLVQHGQPLGRINHQRVGARLREACPGAIHRIGKRAPRWVLALYERQR